VSDSNWGGEKDRYGVGGGMDEGVQSVSPLSLLSPLTAGLGNETKRRNGPSWLCALHASRLFRDLACVAELAYFAV
jgi:hypothetical protein